MRNTEKDFPVTFFFKKKQTTFMDYSTAHLKAEFFLQENHWICDYGVVKQS